MATVTALASVLLIVVILQDVFEVMLLPRRVSRTIRIARFFYLHTWKPWSAVARRLKREKRRNAFLSYFGPLSLLVLAVFWATGLIVGFASLQWAIGAEIHVPEGRAGFFDYLYLSGVTFFTLGFGDVTPVSVVGRALSVVETGIGFGFLAVVVGYLPVLYQAFSLREQTISLLDARAGSPPTAGQLLLRLGPADNHAALVGCLEEWERWAAVVLESHLSFPVLAYYRSQHDNQSWVAALTAVLDACALTLAGLKQVDPYQAQLTFAMARHAVVDLAQLFRTPPRPPEEDRLPAERLRALRQALRASGFDVRDGASADEKLAELRAMYEPFVNALAAYFLLGLPPVMPRGEAVDNWQTSAWMRRTRGIGTLASADPGDDHED